MNNALSWLEHATNQKLETKVRNLCLIYLCTRSQCFLLISHILFLILVVLLYIFCLFLSFFFFSLVCYHHKEVSKFCLNVIPGLNFTRHVFSKCTLNKVRCNTHITVREKAGFYTIPVHYS